MELCMPLQVRLLNAIVWFLLEKGLDYKQLLNGKNCWYFLCNKNCRYCLAAGKIENIPCLLGFVGPCIFTHSNESTN
jgi:hypothetical protein